MEKLSFVTCAHRTSAYLKVFCKWSISSLLIGLICGVAGAAFHHAVELGAEAFAHFDWTLYCLPICGIVIVFLYHAVGIDKDRGTNLVLERLRSGMYPSYRATLVIFLATALTHLGGGSSGREGAALQIGAGISSCFSRLFKLNAKDTKVATMCGMAGLFSAVFGTPVTAAVFSLEVCSVGTIWHTALYPCVLSSMAAWEVSHLLGGHAVRFSLMGLPEVGLLSIVRVVVLTLLCAVCSILFLTVLHEGEHLMHRIQNPYVRIVVGGIAVIILTLLVGRDYNGAGMGIAERALSGSAVPYAFFLKMVFTALTIGSGYKGGEIVPTFFIGATFGCVVGPLMGLDAGFAAAVGMVVLFCSVVNCPLASIILAVELFGGEGLVFFALACGLCYVMSGHYSLYSEQKFVFNKLSNELKED